MEQAAGEILALLGFPDGQCTFLCPGSEAVKYGGRTDQAVIDWPLLLTMADDAISMERTAPSTG